jgi:hypothetical protein
MLGLPAEHLQLPPFKRQPLVLMGAFRCISLLLLLLTLLPPPLPIPTMLHDHRRSGRCSPPLSLIITLPLLLLPGLWGVCQALLAQVLPVAVLLLQPLDLSPSFHQLKLEGVCIISRLLKILDLLLERKHLQGMSN